MPKDVCNSRHIHLNTQIITNYPGQTSQNIQSSHSKNICIDCDEVPPLVGPPSFPFSLPPLTDSLTVTDSEDDKDEGEEPEQTNNFSQQQQQKKQQHQQHRQHNITKVCINHIATRTFWVVLVIVVVIVVAVVVDLVDPLRKQGLRTISSMVSGVNKHQQQ